MVKCPWGSKISLSLSFSLSLLSHTHIHTLIEDHQVSWVNQNIWWMKANSDANSYSLTDSVVLLGKGLTSSEPQCPHFFFFSVPIFVSWDQWYPRTRGVGNHLGLIYVNPWHQILSDCVLIYVLNISFASTPWMSPQRPRARTGCSYCPRVWRDGELEFHSS